MKLIGQNYNRIPIPSKILLAVQLELMQQIVLSAITNDEWKAMLDQYFPEKKTFSDSDLEKQKLEFRKDLLKASSDKGSLDKFIEKFPQKKFTTKFINLLTLVENQLLGPSKLEKVEV